MAIQQLGREQAATLVDIINKATSGTPNVNVGPAPKQSPVSPASGVNSGVVTPFLPDTGEMSMGDESSGLTIGEQVPGGPGVPTIPGVISNLFDVLGGNVENLPPLTGPKNFVKPDIGQMTQKERTEMEMDESVGINDEIQKLAQSIAAQSGTNSFTSGKNDRSQFDPDAIITKEAQTNENKGDNEGGKSGGDAVDDVIRTSVQDYLSMTGRESKAKTTEDYIKEFADATGLDVSGKPDKSTALMTFGLALMQNKAGKGFDVGKMLGEVGEAGEKALPSFEKAKSEARALRAKAGEYALGRTKEDQAKAMQRENFYIIPKGKLGGPLGVVDAITKGKGEFARLNSFELNDLDTNKEFNDKFEIVKATDYADLAKEALKTPEAKKLYSDKTKFIPLFNGAPKDLGFYVQLPDRNAGAGTNPAFIDNADTVIGQVQQMEQSLARQEKRFVEIGSLLNQTDIDIVSQVGQSVIQGFRNLGIDVGGDTTPITQLKTLLTELKAENAAAILQESGKTLSDNDRKMVAEIVGNISYTEGDEKELVRKLGRLYGKIVEAGRRNVSQAYGKLEDAGVKINRKNAGESGSKLRKSESDDADYEFVVSGDK